MNQPNIRDLIKKAVKTPGKTSKEISEEIGFSMPYVTTALSRLIKANEIQAYVEEGERIRRYELNIKQANSRVIRTDSPYWADLHAKSSAYDRSLRKSPRTHVGISHVYNG